MNKGAVLHMPLSQYAYAEDEHAIIVRIRGEKGDIKECDLFYGDRVDPKKNITMKRIPMEKVASDDLYDYFETRISDVYTRVCYYFRLSDGIEKCYYYGRSFCKEMSCDRTEYFQFPYIRREDIIFIPDWAADIVMYHIFPDSFASGKNVLSEKESEIHITDDVTSKNRLGGTLNGVRENIDYIRNLGCNCIYLNPVFSANSYHKYDTIDYFSIDPCLGTMEDLKSLVLECHNKGMKVILDGVFNHCGPNFFAFQDVLKKGKESRYYDWFYYMPEPVEYKDPPGYEAFAYVKEMPKLNTGNREVEDYFCRVGTFWIQEADIDGWRLDVANEINHDFWRRFRTEVKNQKKDIFLIGEIWEDAWNWLSGDQFDSTMNYTFSYLCRDFFAKREMKVTEFDEQIQRMIMRYPKDVSLVQMNFLDSHDIPRFLSYCENDKRKLKLALFYLFVGMGIPSLFYGDECYITGMEEMEYRAGMVWETVEDCRNDITSWSSLRKEHEALRHGRYSTVCCDDETGVYAFIRKTENEQLLVVINNSENDACFSKSELELKEVMIPAMSGKVYDVTSVQDK